MVRNVTFWYTKELSIFENNEDLPTTKVDVTRMPAGENCKYKCKYRALRQDAVVPSISVKSGTYEFLNTRLARLSSRIISPDWSPPGPRLRCFSLLSDTAQKGSIVANLYAIKTH